MKKRYIVSWYGVADFRASVELGDTEGPVLAALKAGDYTDAIILGFTNQDKLGGVASGAELDCSALCKPNPKDTDEIVERFLNTREAHEHFKSWLSVKLRSAGIATEIHFRPVALRHLNDTENIYKAAMESLSEVEGVQDEKSVAIYLSPGTPVMAFVWAFAALRYPNLDRRLITSSQPGLPPEEVDLPIEWMGLRTSRVENVGVSREEYDVIFHLFGEQRMPSLLGVHQFPCKKHIFVNSKKFPSVVMKQFVKKGGYESMPVPPYEPKEIYSSIVSRMERILKSMSNARIGFNLTGGTKLMFAGAFAACRKLGATPLYFDNVNHRVIYMNGFDSDPTRQVESVETFIKLNGDDLVIANKRACGEYPNRISKDRIALTNELFDKRREISQIYNRLSGVNDSTDAFKIENERHGITAKLSSDHLAELSICGKQFKFSNFPWFARYLSGGWLEEYVFIMLKQIKDNHNSFDQGYANKS